MAKRNSISGAFAWRLIEMIESPANRVLSLSAKLVLERLEIELYQHGGKSEENGKLPCTYQHFVEFGIHRHAIAPAIRELVALGFVEITRQGCAGNAGFGQPALYRLTYRHSGSMREPTNEWRRVKTLEEAEAIARSARAQQSERRPKTKFQCRKSSLGPSAGKRTNRGQFPVPETVTTAGGGNHHYLYISGGNRRSDVGQAARVTPPSLALTPGDALPSNAPATHDAGPKLVWTRPIVRELFGDERMRAHATLADLNGEMAASASRAA
jgi:hypothetical protein